MMLEWCWQVSQSNCVSEYWRILANIGKSAADPATSAPSMMTVSSDKVADG
jgi:hypothetical protein